MALLVATLALPLSAGIAIAGLDAGSGRWAGLAAWTLFGLAGSARIIRDPSGHGTLTFHLPFIVAAMTLGGPVAGGWVAMLATLERRELDEVPWYGILANHAGLTVAAIAGGVVVLATRAAGEAIGLQDGLGLALVATLAGTLVLTVVSTVAAAGVIVFRDGLTIRETVVVFNRSFRATAAAETVLGWLLVVAWTAVGWWAPAVCAGVVVALWRTTDAHADAGSGRADGRAQPTGVRRPDGRGGGSGPTRDRGIGLPVPRPRRVQGRERRCPGPRRGRPGAGRGGPTPPCVDPRHGLGRAPRRRRVHGAVHGRPRRGYGAPARGADQRGARGPLPRLRAATTGLALRSASS